MSHTAVFCSVSGGGKDNKDERETYVGVRDGNAKQRLVGLIVPAVASCANEEKQHANSIDIIGLLNERLQQCQPQASIPETPAGMGLENASPCGCALPPRCRTSPAPGARGRRTRKDPLQGCKLGRAKGKWG